MLMDLRNISKLEELKKSMMTSECGGIGAKDIESKINRNIHSSSVNGNRDKGTMNTNYNSNNRKYAEVDMKDIKRGDVLWINLFGSVGSEQASSQSGRPCICIQNNVGNKYSPTIIVACVTSQLTKAKLPVHVQISSPEMYGLEKDSVVLLEQLRTVDKKKRILKKTGCLDELLMKQINKALLASIFELPEQTPLERLPKYMQSKISEILDDIQIYEKALSKARNQSLIENLLEQREAFLWSLQKFCEDNKLNYRDYYKKYEVEKQISVM